MANWSDLKAAVASIVKTNGNKEITGQLLQNVLNNIISNVGLNSSFAGIATPETNPGTPDGNVFYLATTAGTYSNFNGIVINSGEAVILEWKGSWVKKDSGFATKEKLSELGSKVNSVCLRDEIIIETTDSYNVTVSFVSYNFIFAGNKNFMLAEPNLSVNITEPDFWLIYTTLSERKLNYLKYNETSNLPSDSIILMILSNQNGVKVFYSASNTYKIDGIRYNNFNSVAEIVKVIDNKILVPVSIRDGIRFNSSEKTISIIANKDNYLFFENSNRQLLNVPNITIDNNDYGYVVYNIPENILEFVPFRFIANYNSNNYALIALIHNFNNVLWCCDGYFIDEEFYGISELANIKREVKIIEDYSDYSLNNIQSSIRDELIINIDDNNISAKFKDNYYYIFTSSFSSQYINEQVLEDVASVLCFPAIYLDLEEKPNQNQMWNLKITSYKNYFGNISKHSVLVALYNIGTSDLVYSICNTVTVNGAIYKKNDKIDIKPRTNLKYAQIGDSVTFLYDNKYETSFDDRNNTEGKTGYKNENGYGVLFAKSIGVSYDNHYPQGANGRTFCDYYDEWEQGNWSFPNGINIWTIFLGTNDWGTERNPLGTKEDYLNNTYSSENRTTYGAIRKIVDKIRTQNNGKATPKIIFITPMQRGAFAYGNPLGNFMKSAIKKDENGNWEYVSNSHGFTLKDVVDAIKWVCEYESFRCVDLFNNSIVDKKYLNMAQTLEDISDQSNWVYQDTLYDNLHPTAGIGTRKIAGRLINECKYDFYDLI